MTDTLPARRALLVAALGFLEVRWHHKPAAIGALEKWLHAWRGVGDVIVGMSAQGFDVELRAFPDAWRATFYPTGLAHSIVMGTASESTPWMTVQRAAWAALNSQSRSSWNQALVR